MSKTSPPVSCLAEKIPVLTEASIGLSQNVNPTPTIPNPAPLHRNVLKSKDKSAPPAIEFFKKVSSDDDLTLTVVTIFSYFAYDKPPGGSRKIMIGSWVGSANELPGPLEYNPSMKMAALCSRLPPITLNIIDFVYGATIFGLPVANKRFETLAPPIFSSSSLISCSTANAHPDVSHLSLHSLLQNVPFVKKSLSDRHVAHSSREEASTQLTLSQVLKHEAQ
mmetsp:Transcript_17881/g.26618  ORF Transcript_17881/g.26618 Transcript_17881/m.26618 type:complete len:222 (+) Transcript_17881:670-1335(+)